MKYILKLTFNTCTCESNLIMKSHASKLKSAFPYVAFKAATIEICILINFFSSLLLKCYRELPLKVGRCE